MAPGQSATRAAVVLRAGNLVVHVNSLDAINAVVQAMSQFCTPASPTSAKDGGPGTDKPQAHDLVRNAAEEATRYWCNVSERHANGLHQALVPWRKRISPKLLRDLSRLAHCCGGVPTRHGGAVCVAPRSSQRGRPRADGAACSRARSLPAPAAWSARVHATSNRSSQGRREGRDVHELRLVRPQPYLSSRTGTLGCYASGAPTARQRRWR